MGRRKTKRGAGRRRSGGAGQPKPRPSPSVVRRHGSPGRATPGAAAVTSSLALAARAAAGPVVGPGRATVERMVRSAVRSALVRRGLGRTAVSGPPRPTGPALAPGLSPSAVSQPSPGMVAPTMAGMGTPRLSGLGQARVSLPPPPLPLQGGGGRPPSVLPPPPPPLVVGTAATPSIATAPALALPPPPPPLVPAGPDAAQGTPLPFAATAARPDVAARPKPRTFLEELTERQVQRAQGQPRKTAAAAAAGDGGEGEDGGMILPIKAPATVVDELKQVLGNFKFNKARDRQIPPKIMSENAKHLAAIVDAAQARDERLAQKAKEQKEAQQPHNAV